MARFLVSAHLTDRMAETREGFLLCRDVPIARTGSLDYLADETPVAPADGSDTVTVYRFAEDLFDPAAMASFEGKPLVAGHPATDVDPANWRRLARGHLQNVRRGSGADSDLLLADILVTDAEAIAAILQGGVREVSCGYDADYRQIAPGVGRQIAIRGNHVALVDEGRCGPRCAIKDEDSIMKKATRGLLGFVLGTPSVKSTIDADPRARRALDAAIAEEVTDAEPDPSEQTATDGGAAGSGAHDDGQRVTDDLGEIKLLLRSLLEKLDGQQGRSGDEDPERAAITDTDPATVTDTDPDTDPQPATDGQAATDPRKAGDAVRRSGADAAIVRDAAILAPGLAVALGDPATIVQRMALRAASRDGAIRRVVDAALDGARIDDARGGALNLAWASAVEVARARINGRTADALSAAGSGAGSAATRPRRAAGRDGASTPADLNALFAQHRASLKG